MLFLCIIIFIKRQHRHLDFIFEFWPPLFLRRKVDCLVCEKENSRSEIEERKRRRTREERKRGKWQAAGIKPTAAAPSQPRPRRCWSLRPLGRFKRIGFVALYNVEVCIPVCDTFFK